jgi:hypothetical protein
MKIFDSTNSLLAGTMSPVIETGRGFLINSQYYTKDNFVPVPLQNAFISSKQNIISINNSIDCYNTVPVKEHTKRRKDIPIIQDYKNENKYYTLYSNNDNPYCNCILITIEDGKTIEIVASKNISENNLIQEYLYQDDNFLYFLGLTSSNAANTCIYKFNKNTYVGNTITIATLSLTNAYYYNFVLCKPVFMDDNNIFFFALVNAKSYCFIKYEKSTETVILSKEYGSTNFQDSGTIIYNGIISEPFKIDDNKYGIYTPNFINDSFDLFTLDLSKTFVSNSNEMYTVQNTTINLNDVKDVLGLKTFAMTSNTYRYHTFEMNVIEINGKKYLNLYKYYKSSTIYTANDLKHQGIYTLRIDTDSYTDLTLTHWNQISNNMTILDVLAANNKKYLFVSRYQNIDILMFDEEIEGYISSANTIGSVLIFGTDALGRIWYIDTSYDVELINLQDAQTVNIEFEKSYYEYTGTPIETYITFKATDYLKNTISGQFELKVSGSAIFTENNSTKLTFTYNTEMKQIPITITGASIISIYPMYIS